MVYFIETRKLNYDDKHNVISEWHFITVNNLNVCYWVEVGSDVRIFFREIQEIVRARQRRKEEKRSKMKDRRNKESGSENDGDIIHLSPPPILLLHPSISLSYWQKYINRDTLALKFLPQQLLSQTLYWIIEQRIYMTNGVNRLAFGLRPYPNTLCLLQEIKV